MTPWAIRKADASGKPRRNARISPCFGLVDTFNVRIMRREVFHDEEEVSAL